MSLEQAATVWHGAAMARQATKAGGCFLTICILGGTVAGAMTGNAMRGVLLGTGVGAALAILTWLIDRWRH